MRLIAPGSLGLIVLACTVIAAEAPQRRTDWPKLEAWIAGAPVEADSTECPSEPRTALVEKGRALFGVYCVNCHGMTGQGDGPRSPMFDPPPRDLAHGVFKFRTTPSGALPTGEDLFRTISGGLRGTGMLPFADLPEVDRWSLVAYVQALAGHVDTLDEPRSFERPEIPRDIDSWRRVDRGRAAWTSLGCAECHGSLGRGDGSAAKTLVDDAGREVRMPDFATQPFKRGETDADLYGSLVTGLNGTPMPSYSDAADPQTLWDVVAFVRTLDSPPAGTVNERDLTEAKARIAGQYAQATHAVVGGCGCRARKRKRGN